MCGGGAPLIVRIKNNEEVQSYPMRVAQVLPLCRIKGPKSLCGANDVAYRDANFLLLTPCVQYIHVLLHQIVKYHTL